MCFKKCRTKTFIMKTTNKLQLSEIKVQSFVTHFSNTDKETINGGVASNGLPLCNSGVANGQSCGKTLCGETNFRNCFTNACPDVGSWIFGSCNGNLTTPACASKVPSPICNNLSVVPAGGGVQG